MAKIKFIYDVLTYHVRGSLQVDGKCFTVDMDRYGRPEDSYGLLLDRTIVKAKKAGVGAIDIAKIERLAIKRKTFLAAVKEMENRLEDG